MLVQRKLESSLREFFEDPDFSSSAEAASKWTEAYDSYARDAEDVSRDRVAVVNRPGFQAALQFDSAAGQAPLMAQLFDTAFVSYWTGAIFAVGIPPTPAALCPSIGGTGIFATEITSTVILAAPGVLQGLLLPIFTAVTKASTAAQQAQQIATAFHTATTTAVTVLITGISTPPPPSGAPITNTCTVF